MGQYQIMRYINRYIAKKSHHVGSTEVHRDTTNNARETNLSGFKAEVRGHCQNIKKAMDAISWGWCQTKAETPMQKKPHPLRLGPMGPHSNGCAPDLGT